jgi:predicted dehydrogenase
VGSNDGGFAVKHLRVGIIGTGNWAKAAHLPSFAAVPSVEIVALAGIDRAQAESLAAEFGVPAVYGSGRELLERARPNVVGIVTPDDAHVPDAQLALSAGIHVLCEKPLAVTVDGARSLAALAAASPVCTKMGFTLRYAPAVRRLKEIVAGGEIGEPRLVQAFQQNGQFLDPEKPFHWKMDDARTGGGAIVEYGIHTLDLARWIMGEVESVAATARTLVPERPLPEGGRRAVEVDDSTAWLMSFAGGAIGLCHAGWATVGRGAGLELRVYGSRGAVRCRLSDDLPGGEGLWQADAEDQRFEPIEVPNRLAAGAPLDWPWWRRFHLGLVSDFIAEIRDEAEPSATFADGLVAQELLAAVLTATKERRWVEVGRSS